MTNASGLEYGVLHGTTLTDEGAHHKWRWTCIATDQQRVLCILYGGGSSGILEKDNSSVRWFVVRRWSAPNDDANRQMFYFFRAGEKTLE